MNISHLECQTDFSFSITGQNLRPSCQAQFVVCEVKKAEDVEESVPFHSITVESCVEMFSPLTAVCQFVPYAVSHLYCQCKKHKLIGVSHVRYGRRSLVKSVMVVMVISVSLHNQQC